MPSDPRIPQALGTLAPPIAEFRSAVAATVEDVRSHMAQHGAPDTRTAQLKTELGRFADGRIDAGRLSSLLGDKDALAPAMRRRLDRAAHVLREIVAEGDQLFHVVVAPGDSLIATVRGRLASIGRVFGAARIAAAARERGRSAPLPDDSVLNSLPFTEWTMAERRHAPPLVVSVGGVDLRAGGLAEFLDGTSKILLVIDGDCAPAPLVRLITPGVMVVQTQNLEGCAPIAEWPGTAIAAWTPAGCARFVHDPSAGPELWQRIKVQEAPSTAAGRVGGRSVAQQTDEIRQLEALAHRPEAVTATTAAADAPDAGADPVDRLAAWLLNQADLSEPAGGR